MKIEDLESNMEINGGNQGIATDTFKVNKLKMEL